MGIYIRHRDRMVQQSVLQDLRNTLIACRWRTGTTTKPIGDPAHPPTFDVTTGQYVVPDKAVVTTTLAQLLPLVGGVELELIDYFPESDGERGRGQHTAINTFAMDAGRPLDPVLAEMGSNAQEQQYVFNFAFYAASDAVALAVMTDLRDRYAGRICAGDAIDLYDWVKAPDVVAVSMEVDSFRYTPNENAPISAYEAHLFFGELTITDFIDA